MKPTEKENTKLGMNDLKEFIDKHDVNSFRRNRKRAVINLILSTVSIILTIISGSPLLFLLPGIFFGIVGLYSQYTTFTIKKNPLKIFVPRNIEHVYRIKTVDRAIIDNNGRKFSSLVPSDQEKQLEFSSVYSPELCDETAFVSELVDNDILLSNNIEVNAEAILETNFVSDSSDIRLQQVQYLVTKVGDKADVTFNGLKISLESSLKELMNAVSGRGQISLASVGYFDGLITNEAFRSKVVECKRVDIDCPVPYWEDDLSIYFPALRKNGEYFLQPHPCPGISRHIGISTIALTSDNQFVFFRQNSKAAIGGNLFVASGSGSADFRDIEDSGNPGDLKTIIKYSMARELVEESGIFLKLKKSERHKQTIQLALNTEITGFFRWVDRCGKPEFLGVSKLPFPAIEITGDNIEVIKDLSVSNLFKKEVNDLQDFLELKNTFIERATTSKTFRLNLSFLAALNRMVQISSYRDSSNILEKKVFDTIHQFVFAPYRS